MPYFNTKKHYKIWFTEVPQIFLDIENQLRFIKTVNANPGITFTFIYSSKCLNSSAIQNLQSFCARFKIIPIDFDTELSSLLEHDNDKVLYDLAKNEITRTLNHTGGSFACASDIIRLIVPVVAKYGIYGDFEPRLNFSKSPEVIERDVTFILDVSFATLGNDRLLFSFDPNEPSKLAKPAIDSLRKAQQMLIKFYNDPRTAILIGWDSNVRSMMESKCSFSYCLAEQYFKINPKATFCDWKKFILDSNFLSLFSLLPDNYFKVYMGASKTQSAPIELTKEHFGKFLLEESPDYYGGFKADNAIDLADKVFQLIRHRLFKLSVISVTGPQVMEGLFPPATELSTNAYKARSLENSRCSYKKNVGDFYVENKEYEESKNPLEDIGNNPSFEQSWTIEGKQQKESRIQHMHAAASTIQGFWRKYNNSKVDSKTVESKDNKCAP